MRHSGALVIMYRDTQGLLLAMVVELYICSCVQAVEKLQLVDASFVQNACVEPVLLDGRQSVISREQHMVFFSVRYGSQS